MSIYSIALVANIDSRAAVRNIHYYEFFNYVPDETAIQEAVDAVDAAYKSNLRTNLATTFNVTEYEIRRLDVGDLPTTAYTPTAGTWSGTGSTHPLPSQVCALVTWKAPTAFPRTTRCYVAGLTEGNNDTDGTLTSAIVTALESFASDLLTLAITGQVDADKVAVKFGGIPRVVTDSNDVTTYTVNQIWSQQKRRKFGVGI